MFNKNSYANPVVVLTLCISILSFTSCSKKEDTSLDKKRDYVLNNTLTKSAEYYEMHPGFKEAFEFLKLSSTVDLPAGRHEINGDKLFCIVVNDSGKTKAEAKLEAHRKYIDLQYVFSGEDEMGWKPTASCTIVSQEYDINKDIGFFKDEPQIWTMVPAGSFAIFFPEDAHAPMVSKDIVHKIVIKVLLDQ